MSKQWAEDDLVLEELRLLDVKDLAWEDPKHLLAEMQGFDPTQQEQFSFNMFDPEKPWYWQAEVVDDIMANSKTVFLKARQLGMTWVAVAIGLWYMLYRPGSKVVCYSHGEAEAIELVRRAWAMFMSLPYTLRDHVEILKPKGELPNEWIIVRHEDGRLSYFRGLPATEKAGHGETVTYGIMDEVARMDYARAIYTALSPATSRGGRMVMISTANGVSNRETGLGNFFHRLWMTARERGIFNRFLPWNLHPERDEAWYAQEAMALDEVERNQQFPLNWRDAFMLSGSAFFGTDALAWYEGEVRPPRSRGRFHHEGGKGTFVADTSGEVAIYSPPRRGARYGISADVASGKSEDYSSADVIDLESAEIVATLHGKMDIPAFTVQLKFLGNYYRDEVRRQPAMIMPERSGGWGEAVIEELRGNGSGLMPYSNIYRHTARVRSKRPISDMYGYPMNVATRGKILDGLKAAIRQRRIPWLPESHLDELRTFVYRETMPSPRAQDGCNDDRVFSLALAWQMMVEHGEMPQNEVQQRRWRKQRYVSPPMRAGATT